MARFTLRPYGGPARDATVRRVLSHTAGLPSFQNVFFADEPRRVPPPTDTIRRYGLIVDKPGERFQYSNLGYSILSAWSFRSGRGADILPAYAVLNRKGASTAAADAR
jgi:CubicO group peptidase (beta-lactamase class C family)